MEKRASSESVIEFQRLEAVSKKRIWSINEHKCCGCDRHLIKTDKNSWYEFKKPDLDKALSKVRYVGRVNKSYDNWCEVC